MILESDLPNVRGFACSVTGWWATESMCINLFRIMRRRKKGEPRLEDKSGASLDEFDSIESTGHGIHIYDTETTL